jgi:hypothetical protein
MTCDNAMARQVTVDEDGGVDVTSSTGNVTVGNDGSMNITANGTSITTGTNGTTTVGRITSRSHRRLKAGRAG